MCVVAFAGCKSERHYTPEEQQVRGQNQCKPEEETAACVTRERARLVAEQTAANDRLAEKQRASTGVMALPNAAAPQVPTPPVASPQCKACNVKRVACLLGVQRGELAESSNQYADPVQASKTACALDYMLCIDGLGCARL